MAGEWCPILRAGGWPGKHNRGRPGGLDDAPGPVGAAGRTLPDPVQAQRSLRIEWYIVTLIVVEIGLARYPIFWH